MSSIFSNRDFIVLGEQLNHCLFICEVDQTRCLGPGECLHSFIHM